MKVAFILWMAFAVVVASVDEDDGRPWWGRAIYALLFGGIIAAPFTIIALLARLP